MNTQETDTQCLSGPVVLTVYNLLGVPSNKMWHHHQITINKTTAYQLLLWI